MLCNWPDISIIIIKHKFIKKLKLVEFPVSQPLLYLQFLMIIIIKYKLYTTIYNMLDNSKLKDN